MTPNQETLLSLIRAIVRGAHDVPLAMDNSSITAMDICWAKVMEEAERRGCKDFVLTLWSCFLLGNGLIR